MELREPPFPVAVMVVMRKPGNKNDMWDWGVILLLVAGATIALWIGVWVAHAEAGALRDGTALELFAAGASLRAAVISHAGW